MSIAIAKANRILELTSAGQTSVSIMTNAVEQMVKGMAEPGDEDEIDRLVNTVREVSTELQNEFLDEMAKVFTERYTETELDEIIVFFASETGQKYAGAYLKNQQEYSKIGEAWGLKIWNQVQIRLGWTTQP